MTVAVTARELNRATLARQALLRREPMAVPDAVRRVVALQAQQPASPYLALWNRLDPFDPAELDAAFAGQEVVKASLMRVTLHAVHVEDYPAFHGAMAASLRASRLTDARFASLGLTATDADALLPHVVGFAGRPRTNTEIEAMLAERVGALPKPGVWWALRTFAPLVHAPTGGPWSFGPRPSYVVAPVAPPPREDAEHCVRRLVLRYLQGFGPASVADAAQFTRLPRSTVRKALQSLGEQVGRLCGPDRAELFDVPDAERPAGDTPAPPRLMAMWDSVLLAYADRGRVIPADYRRLVIRQNGDVLPTLLVDGHVAGVWRVVDGGIEATAFHRLPRHVWPELGEEAESLLALLAGREPTVYRGYSRWWRDLPGAEVRVLPG